MVELLYMHVSNYTRYCQIVFQSSHTNLYCYQLISSVSLLPIICMVRFLNICQKDGYVIFLIALLSFPNNL